MSKSDRQNEESKLGQAVAIQGKKGKKPRDGPSQFYYEDDNRLNLDYALIQKFAAIGIPPPVEAKDLEKTQRMITDLRDALQCKGKLEQTEGKAKFLRDDSYIKTDEYVEDKKKFDGLHN